MTRKILLSIAPVLALAIFAVIPAFAQAATTEYGTITAGKFTPFTTPTKVTSKKSGTGKFILKAASGAVIECDSFSDTGTFENKAGVGTSKDTLTFDHCVAVLSPTLSCPVQTAGSGSGNIIGAVTDKVLTETTVQITVTPPGIKIVFTGPPPTGCPAAGTVVGTVTGSTTGTQAVGSNILVFNKAKGLKLETEETELTGSNETFTEVGGKPVVIN
jgi:hypothetical protein